MIGDRPGGPQPSSALLATPAGARGPPRRARLPARSAAPARPRRRRQRRSRGTAWRRSPRSRQNDIWSVGARGDLPGAGAGRRRIIVRRALRWHGWRETSVPDVGPLTAVTVTTDGEAWALGPAGAILHWDGPELAVRPRPRRERRRRAARAHGARPDDVWAVGSRPGRALSPPTGTEPTWKTVPCRPRPSAAASTPLRYRDRPVGLGVASDGPCADSALRRYGWSACPTPPLATAAC